MIDWKHVRDIAQAALDGNVIQERCLPANDIRGYDWQDWDGSFPMFESDRYEYRIKPEPREFWIVWNSKYPVDNYRVKFGSGDERAVKEANGGWEHIIKVREVV